MNTRLEVVNTNDLIEFHRRNDNVEYHDDDHIASMAINCQYAQLVQIKNIPEAELSSIRPFVIPTFCYQNAFDTAKMLNATQIVYGLALNFFGELCITAEHAWLKLSDGNMVDPTYQIGNELASIQPDKTAYYSLFAIPISRYAEFTEQLGFRYGEFIAMDFAPIRRSEPHRFLFNKASMEPKVTIRNWS